MQQLTRSYLMLTEDTTRTMERLKAVFRGQAIACTGKSHTARSIAKNIWPRAAFAL